MTLRQKRKMNTMLSVLVKPMPGLYWLRMVGVMGLYEE